MNLAAAFDKDIVSCDDISCSHRQDDDSAPPDAPDPACSRPQEAGQGCAERSRPHAAKGGGVLHGVLHLCVPFRSHCACLRRTLFRAYRGRAPARQPGAVRAPDCVARRGKRRAPPCPPPRVLAPVAAPCPKKKRAAPAAALLPAPILTQIFRIQAPAGRFVKIFRKSLFRRQAPARRSSLRPRLGAGPRVQSVVGVEELSELDVGHEQVRRCGPPAV